MNRRRNNGTSRTALLVALALVLAMIGQQLGFISLPSAQAAIETGVSVTISSPASGTHTFTAADNSTPTNDLLVLPGEQVTITASFAMPAVSDRVHFREDGSGLNADQVSGAAPIVWGWNPSVSAYVLGIFPQDSTGQDLASPIYIRVFSISPVISATPNIVNANGAPVTLGLEWVPMNTSKYVFNPGFGPDNVPTTNAGLTIQQFSVPGVYHPSVKFLDPANNVITTVSTTVYVNIANTTITPANSTQQENTIVKFRVPEYSEFWNATVPPVNTDVIWTMPDGTTFNSRLSTTNGDPNQRADEVSWKVTQSGVIGVSIEADGVEVGTATTTITMQGTTPDPVTPPSYTASADPIWTKGVTGTLSIFVSNPTDNPANMAVRVLAPGYQEYNAWVGAAHTTLPDGRIKLDVPLNFPNVGPQEIKINLDYADANSVWQHLPQTSVTVSVNPQPSGEIIGARKFYVSEPMSFELKLNNLVLQSGDNVLWTGPWGEYNTGSQTNPLTFAKFQTTPWVGNIVVRVQRGNTNLLTVYLNEVSAGNMHGIYLPGVMTSPTQVTITSSTPAPQKGIELLLTAQYPVGGEAHFVWTFDDGRGPYDSTVGHQRGEQPADNQVKFTPGEARVYNVTLSVTKPNAQGIWSEVAIGTFRLDAK